MKGPAQFTNSYMELCLHRSEGANVYLRVPTVWDDIKKGWVGFIKTPKTQRLIYAEGKDSFSLQNAFNRALSAVFEEGGDIAKELFEMFKPLSYWEEM